MGHGGWESGWESNRGCAKLNFARQTARLGAKGGEVGGRGQVDGGSLSLLLSTGTLLVTTSLVVSATSLGSLASVLSGSSVGSLAPVLSGGTVGSLTSGLSVGGEGGLNLEQNLLLSGSGSHVLGLGGGNKVGGLVLVENVGLGVLGLGSGVGLSGLSGRGKLGGSNLLLLEVLLEGLGVVGLLNGGLDGGLGLDLLGDGVAGLLVVELALGVAPGLADLLGGVGLAGLRPSVGSRVSGRLALLLGGGVGGLGPVLVSQRLVGLLGGTDGGTGVLGGGVLLGRAGVLGELLGHNDLVGVLLHVSEDGVKVLC